MPAQRLSQSSGTYVGLGIVGREVCQVLLDLLNRNLPSVKAVLGVEKACHKAQPLCEPSKKPLTDLFFCWRGRN